MKQIFILSILLSFIGGFKVAEKLYRPGTQSELVRKVNRAITSAECTENVHKYIYKQYQRQVLDEYVALLNFIINTNMSCLLYTSPSPRDRQKSRMPSSA